MWINLLKIMIMWISLLKIIIMWINLLKIIIQFLFNLHNANFDDCDL